MFSHQLTLKYIRQGYAQHKEFSHFEDNHWEKALSNKTPALMKSMNMDTCVVCTLNKLYIRSS